MVTAATLSLTAPITHSATVWAGLARPHDALRLLRRLQRRLGPTIEGFEVIAGDCLRHTLAYLPDARAPLAGEAPWHALIEVDLSEAGERAEGDAGTGAVEAALGEALAEGLLLDATLAQSRAQAEAFWRLRESISPAEKAQGPALQFDISVPVERMPDFMIDAARAAEARFPGTGASSFGHLGDGNVHFHVRAPAGTTDGPGWIAQSGGAITRFVHDAVMAAGGSISAEHGIGQMKRAELGRLSSPARLGALRAVKAALDPTGMMNPGKLIPLASEG